MTETDWSMLVLLFAAVLFAVVRHAIEAGPEPVAVDAAEPYVYEAAHRCDGGALPARPEGKASLKREMALAPAEPVNLRLRKEHPDWAWNTDAWHAVRDSWFADQPDDQAVQRQWVGAGRVAS